MTYLIRGGRVIDPAGRIDTQADVLVKDGAIAAVGSGLDARDGTVIDAAGIIVAPGLVDMHAHLREPGREDKETVASGTRAAVHGGFTAVACMPNTEPPIDDPRVVALVRGAAERDAACRVRVVGTITRGRAGGELVDFAGLKRAGAVAVSDDGSSVEDEELMQRALRGAAKEGLLVIAHCEDAKIAGRGVMHKGFVSTKAGLRGIPREAEHERVARDIALAGKAGARIHIAHVSCRESVEHIRAGKKAGVKVTAETCPHYITLTDACCVSYDTQTKMNPPLRTADDVAALIEGVSDGAIDVIATDHAPHTDSEKGVEFDQAPFGIIGFETALALAAMAFVGPKVLDWPALISKMSTVPAAILGCGGGTIAANAPADITVIDPAQEWTYGRSVIASRSHNSPFIGWKLTGRPTHVFVGGKLVVKDGCLVSP